MARKEAGSILQEELYAPGAESGRTRCSREELPREPLDDARLIDLDTPEATPAAAPDSATESPS